MLLYMRSIIQDSFPEKLLFSFETIPALFAYYGDLRIVYIFISSSLDMFPTVQETIGDILRVIWTDRTRSSMPTVLR